MSASLLPVRIRYLGLAEYEPTWRAMQEFTLARTPETDDELWIVEHPPVFTLGQAGKPEHLLADIGVPVIKIDRGGQITYHGPGQVVVYVLVNLQRRKIKVKELVQRIEQAIINVLAKHGLIVNRREKAPGVYVGTDGSGGKIAALGLRIKNGCSYHGLSLNVSLDLSPFQAINPCGYAGMTVARTCDYNLPLTVLTAGEALAAALIEQLEFSLDDKNG
jgi:lipoyl(octanoyl) transferase